MDTLTLNGVDQTASRATDSITSTLVSSHSPLSSKASSSSSAVDSDGSDTDSSDDDNDDDTPARLRALLAKAKESARAKAAAAAAGGPKDELAGGDEVVLFGDEEEEQEGQATPGASSSNEKRHIAPSLTRPLSVRAPTAAQLAAGTLGGKGKGKATAVTLGQDIGGEVESVPGQDRWGRAPLPSLSKKERKARHAPTAGPKWFDMPAPVMTPELKREVQAMRLRNALDPKRFYKGGSKDSQLPEFFQVGHVLESSQRATNAREGKTRKRTFVEELLEDDKAKAYAKRKFQDEVMVKGMSGRKNKHMTKRGGRKR